MQVYGYRMSLWAEHLGGLEDTYQDPESLECVKRVKEIAKLTLKAFVSEEQKEMKALDVVPSSDRKRWTSVRCLDMNHFLMLVANTRSTHQSPGCANNVTS
ncbi:hypothetical protein C1H46_033714 [Malus baccata]|uniref:Phospholipase D C-terminal domain-containing protein n=1 Tax=Malus baccata TaxID=106549 RepID=A0A540L2M2_MALBA|nr:hypothetical protein C1H46_033714 [Malus baccata]